MSSATKTLQVGDTIQQRVKVYGQDPNNNPSQVEDISSPLVLSVGNSAVVSASVDPGDNRLVVLHGVGAGTTVVGVDTSPPMPAGGKLTISVSVTAPMPDDRHIEPL